VSEIFTVHYYIDLAKPKSGAPQAFPRMLLLIKKSPTYEIANDFQPEQGLHQQIED